MNKDRSSVRQDRNSGGRLRAKVIDRSSIINLTLFGSLCSSGVFMANDKLGFFEQRVLAAVAALGEDAYGLAIYNKLHEVERDPNQGSMYVTLDRLERKGYVVSRFILPLPERGGQPRRYYQVKREGALALKESIEMSKKTIKIVPKTFWQTTKRPIKFRKRFV